MFIYVLLIHPVTARVGSLYLSQIMDDPVAAYNFYTKMTEKQDYTVDLIKDIRGDRYPNHPWISSMLSGFPGYKIYEIDDYCIGYRKVQDYFEQYMLDGDIDSDEYVELRLDAYTDHAQCVLYLDEKGRLNCGLKEAPTGSIPDVSDLAFYKSLQSMVNACGKHKNIDKFYVMSNYMNEWGVIFFIDDKGMVYAEPYGYNCDYDHDKYVVTPVDDYIGMDELKKWRDVTDLKLIDTGHLCIPNLCGLNDNGEILSVFFHVRGGKDSEWYGIVVDIDDYEWDDIQSRKNERDGLLHPDTDNYSEFDPEKYEEFDNLPYTAEWIVISGYTGEVLNKGLE